VNGAEVKEEQKIGRGEEGAQEGEVGTNGLIVPTQWHHAESIIIPFVDHFHLGTWIRCSSQPWTNLSDTLGEHLTRLLSGNAGQHNDILALGPVGWGGA